MRGRVAVGMSGGVDSSVVAKLLVDQGYEVVGVYLHTYGEMGCRANQDRRDALRVAEQIGIKFEVIDLRKEYRESVIDYFEKSYAQGLTPNPDIVCNREIKFGLFWEWMNGNGFDKLATGHYARVEVDEKGESWIYRAKDKTKDQSYFLWQVKREKLAKVIFPLGELKKAQVRELAKKWGLVTWDKPDSMGVCMAGEKDIVERLRSKFGEKRGEVVMVRGNRREVVGYHRGLWFSTVGQRVGREISLQGQTLTSLGLDRTKMPVLYVVGKEIKQNRLVIGEREAGYTREFELINVRLESEKGIDLWVRVRNLGKLYLVERLKSEMGRVQVKTKEKIWGVAGGQSAVFYDKKGRLVGGGEIV